MGLPLDGGRVGLGEEIQGFPKAKGRKSFKREGVLQIRLSNVELPGVLNRSSRGDMVT